MAPEWSIYIVGLLYLIGILSCTVLGEENGPEDEHVENPPEDEVMLEAGDLNSCKELYTCEPCDKLEFQIHPEECSVTGYRHILRCHSKDDKFESCPNELKSFWIFELFMLIIGVTFGIMTMFRRRHLDRLVKERIMEQIQNSA